MNNLLKTSNTKQNNVNLYESFTANEVLLESIDYKLLQEYQNLEEGAVKHKIKQMIRKGKYFLSSKYRNKINNYRLKMKSRGAVNKHIKKTMAKLKDLDKPLNFNFDIPDFEKEFKKPKPTVKKDKDFKKVKIDKNDRKKKNLKLNKARLRDEKYDRGDE